MRFLLIPTATLLLAATAPITSTAVFGGRNSTRCPCPRTGPSPYPSGDQAAIVIVLDVFIVALLLERSFTFLPARWGRRCPFC